MIVEKLIDFFVISLNALFNVIPVFSLSFSANIIEPFLEIIRAVGFLLPMGTILNILYLSLSIQVFKIFIAVFKTLWDVLPFT